MLARIIDDKSLTPRAVYGFWPAAADGDDVVLYRDGARTGELCRLPMLRQQELVVQRRPHQSLSDFVAPAGSDLRDHVGAFAVTAGLGAAELAKRYEDAHDDYNAILVKALADRLAEAFAEVLHRRARLEWGYGEGEDLTLAQLIAEEYRGIRPAFGYPACPDHTPKRQLFELLDPGEVGIRLTDGYAMTPAASVSGLYLAHPQARYFALGKLGRDQVEDYARRRGVTVAEAERWLAPNLGYDPGS